MYEQFQNIMKMGPFSQIMVRNETCCIADTVHTHVHACSDAYVLWFIFCNWIKLYIIVIIMQANISVYSKSQGNVIECFTCKRPKINSQFKKNAMWQIKTTQHDTPK